MFTENALEFEGFGECRGNPHWKTLETQRWRASAIASDSSAPRNA
jgi:hypothetical protein